MDKKSIFNFDDYRAYLQDFVKSMPKSRGVLKAWSEHLNVHTTLVSQIMMGRRDFTEEQGLELIEYLGVGKLEKEYFLELLRKARAGTKKLKDHHQARIKELKAQALKLEERISAERKLTEQESAIFYSSWLYSAIRLSCSIGEGLTLEEIVEKFNLPRETILKALEFLRETGFVKQEGVRYVMGSQYTHLGKSSPYLVRHHSNWRLKALQRADLLTDQELMYTAPFSIAHKDFEVLREHLVQVIQDFLKIVKSSHGEEVACFNMDLFWVAPKKN